MQRKYSGNCLSRRRYGRWRSDQTSERSQMRLQKYFMSGSAFYCTGGSTEQISSYCLWASFDFWQKFTEYWTGGIHSYSYAVDSTCFILLFCIISPHYCFVLLFHITTLYYCFYITVLHYFILSFLHIRSVPFVA